MEKNIQKISFHILRDWEIISNRVWVGRNWQVSV